MDEIGPTRQLLQIVVDRSCAGCETARQIASCVGARGLAGVEVSLIDLSEPGAVRPPAVFAVPTYLLDGRIVSLGNPDPDWLLARLGAPSRPDQPASAAPSEESSPWSIPRQRSRRRARTRSGASSAS